MMLRGVMLTVLLIVGAANPAGSATARTTVTMAVVPTLSSGPIFLAADRGYFHRFGIDVVLERLNDPVAFTTLNAGRLDLVHQAFRPIAMELAGRGGRIRAVAAGTEIPTQCTPSALVVSAAFAGQHTRNGAVDLRGARIAANNQGDGSLFHFMTLKWLERAGVTERDVTFVRMPLPAHVEALTRGTIDAAVAAEPFLSAIVAHGAGVIVDRAQAVIPRMPVSALFVGPSLRNHPGLVARALAAYLLGVRDYMSPEGRRDPETLRILTRHLGQSEDTIRRSCWQPIPRDGRISAGRLETLRDWQLAGGFLTSAVPMETFIDERYLREAWRLLDAAGDGVR